MKEQTTIRLPQELLEQLRREAQDFDSSVDDYIVSLIKHEHERYWSTRRAEERHRRTEAIIDEFIRS